LEKENTVEISSKPSVHYRDGSWRKDKYLRRWLLKKEASRENYLIAIEKYVHFTGMTPKELIDEKWEDTKKRPHEREDIAEQRLADFHSWLVEGGYKKYGRYAWKGETKVSENTAKAYYAAVRSFFTNNGLPLNMKPFGVLVANVEMIVYRR